MVKIQLLGYAVSCLILIVSNLQAQLANPKDISTSKSELENLQTLPVNRH